MLKIHSPPLAPWFKMQGQPRSLFFSAWTEWDHCSGPIYGLGKRSNDYNGVLCRAGFEHS